MKSVVTLSKLANRQLIHLMKKNQTKNALFLVESGGCNGLKYKLEPLPSNNKEIFKEKIKLDEGYTLNICDKSVFYLLGTNIGWQDDFMGQNFIFENPNEQSSCGCGQTFSPKF